MVNPIKIGIAAIGIGACLYFTIGMLWAELGMPAEIDFPHTIKLLQAQGITTAMVDHYNGIFKTWAEGHLTSGKADGPLGDYTYAFTIAVAFFGGALAIMAIGSEDETEKTMLPDKK